MRIHRPLLSALLLSTVLAGQTGLRTGPDGDRLVLERPDHRVEFDATQRRFVRGAAAMRWQPVALARGDAAVAPFAPVAPRVGEATVLYEHGHCTERYAPCEHGVELSFVFAALPVGSGDLVVRLAAMPDEPARASGPHGLCFGDDAATAIVWGDVTGIAADGARARGTITWDGTHIELRLPAAFVATAALPLVLDPLIGVTLSLANFGTTVPDIAGFGAVVGTAVCVYQKDLPLGTGTEVRARPLGGVGQPMGAEFVVTNDGAAPRIAAIPSLASMACVFERSGQVRVCTLTPSGQVSSSVGVGTGTNEAPDVGGDASSGAGLCVFHDVTADSIRARPFTVAGLAAPVAGAAVTIATAATLNNVRRPRISRSGGADARYLVVWENQNLIAGSTSVQIAAVNAAGVVLDSRSLGAGSWPEVDGDGAGRQWLVAFQRAAATGDDDVVACAVSWSSATASLAVTTPVAVSALANVDERHPAVCWPQQSALVGWERSVPGGTDTDLFLKTIDGLTCAQCQPTELVVNSAQPEDQLAFAPVGVLSSFGAAVVWREGPTGIDSLRYSEFRNRDGLLVSLASQAPCAPDTITSGCPRLGNGNFRIRLRDAAPGATSWLVLSTNGTSLTCGCTLVADPFTGFLSGGIATNAAGQAEVALAIPSVGQLSGIQFVAQWIVANPAGACGLIGADFSRATLVVVQ